MRGRLPRMIFVPKTGCHPRIKSEGKVFGIMRYFGVPIRCSLSTV